MNKRFFLIILSILYSISGHSQKVNPDSLVPYRIGNKWGYSDMKGKIIIAPQYEDAYFFNGHCAIVAKKDLYYLINPKNKLITKGYTKIDWDYNCDGILCFKAMDIDKEYCLDTLGNKIKSCECNGERVDIAPGPDFLINYRNIDGQVVAYFSNDSAKKVYNKIARVDYWGILENYYLFENNNLKGIVFNDGKTIKLILEPNYQDIRCFSSDDKAYFILSKNNLSGLATETNTLIPFKYKYITWNWHNNLLWVRLENDKTGYVNFNGFEYFKD